MARSRLIKPAFFQNEQLAECTPLERLAFIGMWTIADYKGCLELRPMRLKVQLLPYDDCDFEKIAINLDKSGLIRTYSVQGKRYIKIINFVKHQNPHKNERESGSDIPDYQDELSEVIDYKELTINHDKSRLIQNNLEADGTDLALTLNPLTLTLKPITGLGIDDDTVCNAKEDKKQQKFTKPTFEEIKEYIKEKRYYVNPEKFFAFYESNGWKVGKNPMKCWKSAIRSWNADSNGKEKPINTQQIKKYKEVKL